MDYCKFHPLSEATRSCVDCRADYCDACCDESLTIRNRQADLLCFVCNSKVVPLASVLAVPPFWRNLSGLYRYPIQVSAVMVVLLCSLFLAIFAHMPLFQLIPSMAMTLYCFACLRETAEGRLEAPDVAKCFEGTLAPIFYVFIMIFVAIVFTGLVATLLGNGFGMLAGLFSTIVVPAAVILIAINERLLPALNPGNLIEVVSKTGASYFVMWLFLLMMMSSVAVLISLFDGGTSFVGVFLQSAVGNYYNIVLFHILGYLVHQNQHALGFATHKTRQIESVIRSDEKRLDAKLEVLIKAGRYTEAIDASKRQIESDGVALWHWGRCFKLMCTGQSTKELESFIPKYFTKLESEKHLDTLADTYVTTKKRLPKFSVKDHAQKLRIAEYLLEIGRYKYVVEMLHNFHTVCKDKEQVYRALALLSQSYAHIPGKQKSARFYQDLVELRNKPATS